MIISSAAVAAAILAYGATAQLMLPRVFDARNGPSLSSSSSSSSFSHVTPDRNQHPLVSTQQTDSSSSGTGSKANAGLPAYRAGQFTLTPQDNTTCATYGESQWTGTVDVSDSRRLFFWFFDSRSDPANDPIVVWINGGPGSSSMAGLFNEMGACWLEPGADDTVPNEWAWNNNASVLFLDQPAGVGFSSVADGAPIPSRDMDGAQDFQAFLNVFFADVFPDRAHLPIHFAAESYGGHYAPVYVNHILESRRYDSKTAFWGNITSVILVNAVVDFVAPAVGAYELLCKNFRDVGRLVDEAACEAIALNLPGALALGRNCEMSDDGNECLAMYTFTEHKIHGFFDSLNRSPYNILQPCGLDSPSCSDPTKGDSTAYLNQEHIKAALNFPASFTYESFSLAVNSAYRSSNDPWRPTTRELAAILDAHRAPDLGGSGGDVRLLVLQGNVDYILNTPGNMWAYDNLRWSGQADYRLRAWRELPREMAATGVWKGTEDGRLVFVTVDGAGHMVPGDVREGSYRIAQRWLEGGWR